MPWHKLTQMPELQGVLRDWEGFPHELLHITPQYALAVPCSKENGCYMDVVVHEGEYTGICTLEPRRCDRQGLTKEETVIYKLNTHLLFTRIAEALDCQLYREPLDGLPYTWKLGTINPQAEYQFPVYLSFATIASSLDKVFNQLSLQSKPFLLIGIERTSFSYAVRDAAKRQQSLLLGLEDLLEVNSLVAKPALKGVLSDWLDPLLPKHQKPGTEYRFPTPAGARWEQFVFEFIAEEVLLVTCGNVHERLEPEHLQMKNQYTGKPTNQWTLLLIFASTGGNLSWDNPKAKDYIKKQKQVLAQKLKQVFGLSVDSIYWDARGKCYRVRFTVKADKNISR